MQSFLRFYMVENLDNPRQDTTKSLVSRPELRDLGDDGMFVGGSEPPRGGR